MSTPANMEDEGRPQLLVFVLDEKLFGCPLSHVREIIPHRPTTRLPGALEHVVGLLNLRGTLLTVLDLGVALGARNGQSAEGQVLVIEADGRVVGCRVDAVQRVYPFPELLPSSQVGNGMPHGIVLGIGDAGDNMVAVLDLPVLIRQTLLFPGER